MAPPRTPAATNISPLIDLARQLGPSGNFLLGLSNLQNEDRRLTSAIQQLTAMMGSQRGQAFQQSGAQQTGTRALLQARLGASQLNAQASYLRTPQGQQQYRDTLAANKQQGAAQERIVRAQNVAQYGAIGGGLRNMGMSLAKLNPYIQAASTAVNTFREGLNMSFRYAAKASPNSGATYTKSWDVLEAKLGQILVPLLEGASGTVQRATSLVDMIPKGARDLVGTFAGATLGGPPKKRSRQGLPQASIGSAMQYQQAGQLAVLNMGGNSLEADLLKIQVDELRKIGGLLKENPRDSDGKPAAFR